MTENIVKSLLNEVVYADKSITSKKILTKKNGNITVFSFDKDESISPHKAPFDALVLVLEGEMKITIEDEEHILRKDEFIILPIDKTHALYALDRSKVFLIMIKE